MNAKIRSAVRVAFLSVALAFTSSPASAVIASCGDIQSLLGGTFSALHTALVNALPGTAGLGNQMWATIVNRDGEVCAVAFSGADRQTQWPGSRVITIQKAYTGNAFSLDGFALSTANLYSAVQPGGSLFGLQESNPVDPAAAYGGFASNFGTGTGDPAVTHRIGGINVFGGGLALYNRGKQVVGAIGVSGDTSCRDHIIAWKVRHALVLDFVPAGVSPTGDDNIIFDITGSHGNFQSKSGFGHPQCGFGETPIAVALPTTNPISH